MSRFLLFCAFLGFASSSSIGQEPATKAKAPDAMDKMAAELKPSRILVYKKIADRELQMHVFEPSGFKAGDKRACYVIIHGGGWTGGAPPRMYPFAAHYAKLGMVGISVQYRLHSAKTGVSVFDCVKDARSAVRYIKSHASELGIDPTRIIVSGGSAGGHLAAATALFDKVNEDGDDLSISATPAALVLLFPVIDTSKEGYGQAKIGERWQELSPVHNVRAGLPPTLVFHGTGDTVTPFAGAKAFDEAMLKAGNRCELDVNEGGTHGYLMRDKALYDDTMTKTDVFLKSLGLLK
ncbi:alpha/beta hydrolase [Brevifollis gellanilyticus]|uniref:Lipase n=1 Tax=Brevifollis gellanilyticus TaxID=748831 RepID=A0A512M7Z2_9BACT|nr:alpha/beta hydrolase [Brevifollis gellanilyticus]GEP42847.1 lipase [Brevifollis gellanilyticus]